MAPLQLVGDERAVDSGQLPVEQDEIRWTGLEECQRLLPVLRFFDVVPLTRQCPAQDSADRLLVVDDQDPARGNVGGMNGLPRGRWGVCLSQSDRVYARTVAPTRRRA